MKTQILGCIVGLGVLAPFSFVSCTEPLPPCLVEDASAGPYIMTYVVAGPVPTCATGIVTTGEQVGMSFYHPEIVNSDGSTTFDPNVGHVAIQGADMSAAIGPWNQVGDVDSTVGDELYAYGRFKAPLPRLERPLLRGHRRGRQRRDLLVRRGDLLRGRGLLQRPVQHRELLRLPGRLGLPRPGRRSAAAPRRRCRGSATTR